MEHEQHQVFAISDKLDRLFAKIHPPGKSEYSYAAVASAIREQQGISISHTYLWQLRTGRRDNPTIQHLTALANFFGVPVGYFLDDEEARRIDGELDLLAALRDSEVSTIALRAADLSPSSRQTIIDMIHKVWELENPNADGKS